MTFPTPAEAHVSKCMTAAYTPRIQFGLLYARGRAYCPHSHAASHGMTVELQVKKGRKWYVLSRKEESTKKAELYVVTSVDCSEDSTENQYRTRIQHYRDGHEGRKWSRPKFSGVTTKDC